MERIEVEHVFHVELSKAFNYIVDTTNWPEYWPGFVRLEDSENAQWREPGDKITVVLKVLGRERSMHMELERFQANALVLYRTRQDGLPDAHHERHFNAIPKGFEYRAVIDFEPRQGLQGVFDRLVVKRGIERTLRKTVDKLDRLLENQ